MDGDDITTASVPARARAGLGRTFQTSSLFPRLSVLENVRLAAQVSLGGDYSLLRFPRRTDAATELALAKLEAVGLSHKLDAAAGDISHGDKRKLEIAVLLATGREHRAARRADGRRRLRRRRRARRQHPRHAAREAAAPC